MYINCFGRGGKRKVLFAKQPQQVIQCQKVLIVLFLNLFLQHFFSFGLSYFCSPIQMVPNLDLSVKGEGFVWLIRYNQKSDFHLGLINFTFGIFSSDKISNINQKMIQPKIKQEKKKSFYAGVNYFLQPNNLFSTLNCSI